MPAAELKSSLVSRVYAQVARRETVIPAVIALLISGIIAPWMNFHYTQLHDKQEANRRVVSRFESEADAFGPFATVFVLAISRDGKVDPQSLERLASNIVSQKNALDGLVGHVPPRRRL